MIRWPTRLGRHQVAAFLGTCVDFGAMIALVELAGLSAPLATVVSALCGGVTNFLLSRTFVFRDLHQGSASSQAVRYALASFGGALLNALLLKVVLSAVPMPYPIARAFVAIAISLAYTYPVHTRFVFRAALR